MFRTPERRSFLRYVAVYVWIGALIDFVLTMLLVLTVHWWTRPLLNVSPRKPQSSTPRWFWLLVARGDGSQFLDLLATALAEFLARRKLPNTQATAWH